MKIALVGNQNSGKTSLFNLLTGSNQKIGNWPGVTIERKSGVIKDTNHELIDLPGIYSLSPYSEEEKISRDFILNEKVDLIINVVDSTSIERSLYLTTQLKELDIPIVVVLNMMDLAYKKGVSIDKSKLSEQLGVKVVEMSALKNIGVEELKNAIEGKNVLKNIMVFDSFLENKIKIVSSKIDSKHKRFVSIKLLEKEELFENMSVDESIREEISKKYNGDVSEVIANQRYEFICKIKEECVELEKKRRKYYR